MHEYRRKSMIIGGKNPLTLDLKTDRTTKASPHGWEWGDFIET